jgi:hypothetical protein
MCLWASSTEDGGVPSGYRARVSRKAGRDPQGESRPVVVTAGFLAGLRSPRLVRRSRPWEIAQPSSQPKRQVPRGNSTNEQLQASFELI